MGFCLAWCIWYIEIKMKNPTLTEKDLIQKASDKIFASYCDSYSPYNDFIRDYAGMLDEEKNLLLKDFGVDFMEYYKKTFSDKQIRLISEGINSIVKIYLFYSVLLNIYLYCKISPYIVTIEILYEEDINSWPNIGFNKYCIFPDRSKIYEIEDVTGKKYNEISIEHTNFKVGDLISKFMRGYKNKEIAFFEDFIEKKEYELFQNGYTGPYKQYWYNGVLHYEIFLINGKEYGEFICYYDNNNLHIVGNKIDGKYVGEVKVFDTDGKTLILTEYY